MENLFEIINDLPIVDGVNKLAREREEICIGGVREQIGLNEGDISDDAGVSLIISCGVHMGNDFFQLLLSCEREIFILADEHEINEKFQVLVGLERSL